MIVDMKRQLHVDQILANFELAKFKPGYAVRWLLQEYVAEKISLDALLICSHSLGTGEKMHNGSVRPVSLCKKFEVPCDPYSASCPCFSLLNEKKM